MESLADWNLPRRSLLAAGSLAWLAPVARLLGGDPESPSTRGPARALILLWMAGGPSQLETFDPHPGKAIAGGTRAIDTALPGVQLAAGFERLAEQMPLVTLVRNVFSKEGDHERGTVALKTGYPPETTLVHPTIGAICCHETEQADGARIDIPRYISILPDRFPSRGGFLGNQYDAFKTYDPQYKVPDVGQRVPDARFEQRLRDVAVVEQAFSQGRATQATATLHRELAARARRMMTSEQLRAFDVTQEPAERLAAYGDTPFGRGCLAARRLVETGVRCVEVTLGGWDSHVNNHETQQANAAELDPAIAALLADLRDRNLLDSTIVMCCGEFGRTPKINRLGGRDHWPAGFSMLLAGGRLPRGHVRGATDPDGGKLTPENSTAVADLHATVLTALGIDAARELISPIGRPIKLSEGQPLAELLT